MSTKNVLEQMLQDLPGEAKLIVVIENNLPVMRYSCPDDKPLIRLLRSAISLLDADLIKHEKAVKSCN